MITHRERAGCSFIVDARVYSVPSATAKRRAGPLQENLEVDLERGDGVARGVSDSVRYRKETAYASSNFLSTPG